MMPIDRKLQIAAFVGASVGILLGTVTVLIMPSSSDPVVVATQSGVFQYRRGGARSAAVSTLDGRAVDCVASAFGTRSDCQIAQSGKHAEFDFAAVPTAFGSRDMVVSARQGGQLAYSLTGKQLRSRWLNASLLDAIIYAAIASVLAYTFLTVKAQFSKGP